MIYSRGNAAKQWIFCEIDRLAQKNLSLRVLDLACGDGSQWTLFFEMHPQIEYHGVDTDERAIAKAKERFAHAAHIQFFVFDAQRSISESSFDVVTALSAVEHVVDRMAFLKTVWQALPSGGVAYLNYDVGHFRSRHWKERLMVPVSQVLALIGFQGLYMKRVDDAEFEETAKHLGFRILSCRKHNLFPLKKFFRCAKDHALESWFAFEEELGKDYTSAELNTVMWSTTFVIEKP